jgi:hypothetical protein
VIQNPISAVADMWRKLAGESFHSQWRKKGAISSFFSVI